MPLTERERQKLQLIESRGYPVDWAAAEKSFNLTCSPITTIGVAPVDLLISLANLTTTLFEKTGKTVALTGIVLFPTICDPSIYSPTDKLAYKRKDNAYFVRKTIDFEAWGRARRPKRLRFAVENFEASIAWIPERHLSKVDRDLLLNLLHVSAEQIGSPGGKGERAA